VTAATGAPAASLQALLADAVDYAGLFPPASLGLDDVARLYTGYRRGSSSWALGRLVVPAVRLPELADALAARPLPLAVEAPVALSVILGADVDGDVYQAESMAKVSALCRVASLEAKAADAAGVEAVARTARDAAERLGTPLYVELPLNGGLKTAVAAVRQARLRAKARTGGVVPSAVPSAGSVADFIAACAGAGVAFKLTSGLHHAVRGRHPLTYERSAPSAVMHGFVNVFVAAALLVAGVSPATATQVLEETDGAAFRFGEEAIEWHAERVDLKAIHESRELLVSFGSCSFEEPMTALAAWSAGTAGL
jgi:hypothetical protein